MSNDVFMEYGIVSKTTRAGYVHIRLSRKTACENCRMCLMPKEEMYVELKTKNVENLKHGDYVCVKMPQRAVLNSALIFYLFPLIIVAITLFSTFSMELWICLTSVLASLIISYIVIILLDKKVFRKLKMFVPTVTKATSLSETEKGELSKLLKEPLIAVEDELGQYVLSSEKQKEASKNDVVINAELEKESQNSIKDVSDIEEDVN